MIDIAVRMRSDIVKEMLTGLPRQCGWDLIILYHGNIFSLLDRIPT